jgi:predicted  nucleic acid-binding Zn ribbon protein
MNTNVKNVNPLEGYLRVPKLYVQLPSRGKFSTVDTQSEITNEIPIFPMTAKDETMLRNPDALLNGESLVSVIKSVTGIQDVYNLASNDLDVILLASRLATYGKDLEIKSTCPECKHEHDFDVNIEAILETVTELNDEYIVTLDNGLTVYIRPYTFKDTQTAALQAFRETTELNKLTSAEGDELKRLVTFNKSFQAMADLNIQILANSVIKVVIPALKEDEDATIVTNRKHILAWVQGIGKSQADAILDEANKVNGEGLDRNAKITCPECKHEYTQLLEFNPSSFFDLGS